MAQRFPSKIQILWEKFLQAESASYEKSTWFDGFLTQFLVEFKEGNSVQDILPFTPLAGVSTLIGCELLSDVHQICSQPGDGEDLAPLRRHFLLGRGWRTLAVLHCLGVQDVSCGAELSTLLISLYPVCLQPLSSGRKSSTSLLGSRPLAHHEENTQSNHRNPYVALVGCWNKPGVPESNGYSSPGACSSHGHRGYSLPGLLKISPSEGPYYRKWSTSSRPGSIGGPAPQQARTDQLKNHSNSSIVKQRRRSRNIEAESPRGVGSGIQSVTSESEAPQDASEVLLNKSNTLKIRLDPMDFDYFESVVRSEDEMNNEQPLWRSSMRHTSNKLTAEDLTDDRMREVCSQTINCAEFSQLVVHLLEELCRAELPISTQQVSLQSVNFALENLCSLQFGSTPVDALLVEEVLQLKLAMTQLLLTALDKVLMQSEIINQLINAGVLPVMLRVLEDAVRRADSFSKAEEGAVKTSQVHSKSVNISPGKKLKTLTTESLDEICGLQEFVMGILYGAVTFLHCLLLHRSSTERIHEFEEQFRLFASSCGGRLVEKTVSALLYCGPQISKNSVCRGRKVVCLIVQLILSIKQARSTIVHSLQCRKTRHKHCKAVDARRHHHNDLFGNPFASVGAGNVGMGHHSNSCNVAYLFAALVRILNNNSHIPDFCVPLMKVMLECGTCCCYPAKSLLICLTKILKTGNAKARTLGFTLLERTVFTELGAIETQCTRPQREYFRCSICNRSVEALSVQSSALEDSQEEAVLTKVDDSFKTDTELFSSISVSSDRLESSDTKQYNWSCLDFYRELFCSDDPKLCYTAASHLLKLSPRCSEQVQVALLSKVFYPSFLQAKKAFLSDEKDVSKFIILSCLSAFSCLMSSLPLAETFLSLGGLHHVLDLMIMPPFLKMCCSILEIVVVVDVLNLDKSLRSQVPRATDAKVPLHVSIPSINSEKVCQLTSLVKLIECLELYTNDLLDKMKNEEEGSEDIQLSKSKLKVLQHVVVFWQTVANLALCSPQLRPFFATHSISGLGFVLLRNTLQKIICNPNVKQLSSNRDTESFLLVRLIESVLVLHFTAPPIDAQSGLPTSRETLAGNLTKSLCRQEVLSLCERSPGNAGSLRRLCDVLIRCALAEASSELVLPALRKAKLPILSVADMFPEASDDVDDPKEHDPSIKEVSSVKDFDSNHDQTGVSEEGSSVEDPYVTADEGYEADVEVLDSKRNRMSMAYDSSTSGSQGTQQNVGASAETNKTGLSSDKKHLSIISFPTLCSMSINLLVFLHQEVERLAAENTSEASAHVDSPNSFADTKNDVSSSSTNRFRNKSSILKSQLISDMVHVIQRIVALCRESGRNCMVLSQEGVINILLTGFSNFLSQVNPDFNELQSVVLELFALLSQHSITSQELSKYLHFFKGQEPPLESLLQPLTTLVASARPQPNFILCFPVNANEAISLSSPDMEISQDSRKISPEPRQRKISGLMGLAANISVTGSSRSSSSSEAFKASTETTRSQSAAVALAQSIRLQHITSRLTSAWSECALALPIESDLGWCAWLSGFSISLWLRTERGAVPENTAPRLEHHSGLHRNYSGHLSDSLSDSWSEWGVVSSAVWLKDGSMSINKSEMKGHLHLVSIGTDNLMLEVWADVSSDSLQLKLSRSDGKNYEILAESATEVGLPPGQWHHLAVNVRDFIQRKKSVIEVTLIIDGLRELKCPLQFNGIVLRKAKPTCLLVGHALRLHPRPLTVPSSPSTPSLGSWYLGSLQLFRCPVFNRERAVYVVGLGPSHTSLTDCKVGRDNPNFTSIFGVKILNSGVAWDSVLENGVSNLKELQDNLLITYSAQNPTTMNVYPQVVGSSGAGMGSLFPGQPGFRVVTPDQRASQQLPLAIEPTLYGPLNTQQYKGLVSAVSTLGGAHVFLFLFARVVELRANEVEQGKALYLLLKLVQSDTSLFSQFVQEDCHKLLLKILGSQRCLPGHHMLKAVLDACCDKPVLLHHQGPQCQFRVAHQSEAIVVNSFLLSTIVGSWRDWERVFDGGEDGGVLGTLFRALHVLLRDDHPYREFNASQFNRVRLVEALLLFCKERFLYEEWQPLHPSVCCSLIELVRSLMGAPPEFSHIVAVADCLLLLHPASASYITHVRPSYYFLLSPTPPTVPPQPQPRRTIRPGLFEHGEKETNHHSQKKKKLPFSGRREHTGSFTQPVDPCKLNKALANLQIKRSTDDTESCDYTDSILYDHNRYLEVIDSNKVDEGSEPNISDLDGDLVDGCSELTALDSGIAGSFREHTGSSDIDLKEGISDGKKPDILDRADLLMIQAEGGKLCENSEHSVEKFTTEMNLKEKQHVVEWTNLSSTIKGRGKDGNIGIFQDPSMKNGSGAITSNNSLCLVVEGLLLLLRDTLLVLPDNMASQVLNHVVQAETLLVMTNNGDARVRAAVVKVLGAYLQRATEEELNKFVKVKGFFLLASQLGLYPATPDLIESCAALVTQRGDTSIEELIVSLTEQLDLDQLAMSPHQLSAFPPLLGMLPRAIHDIALTHNTLAFIREVLQQVKGAFRPLLDAGLIEVLLKLLVLVAHQPPEPTDIVGSCTQDLLISDINVFLLSIMGYVLSTPGSLNMQVLNDIQLQLNFLFKLESSSCGAGSRCVAVLHDAHCTILDGTLNMMMEKLSSQHSQIKGQSLLSASYDELGSYGSTSSTQLRVPVFTLLSHHSSFSSSRSGGNLLRPRSTKDISRSELYERFKTIIVKAVEFFIYSEPREESMMMISEVEQTFARRLFSILLKGLCSVIDRRSVDSKSLWNGAMWAARDTLRVRSAQLLVWLLSPWQPLKMRMYTVYSLRAEPRAKELFTSMLHTHSQVEQKFTVWLWALMYGHGTQQLPPADVRTCEELKEQLQRWGVLSPHAIGHSHDNWEGEVTLLLREAERQRATYVAHGQEAMERSVHKMEQLHHALVDGAMSATRCVVEAQNSERKVFMEHIKSTFNENVQLRIKWQQIIQLLTHERAVWSFPKSYPESWQLDATEGPARVRKRLQRCHLHIKEKFLLSEHQEKLEHLKRPAPLQYLFEQDTNASSTSSVMIEKLHTNEKIQYMCAAHIITPACELPGELLIGESCLYFVADDSPIASTHEMEAGLLDMSSTAWQFEDVKEIIHRRYQLQERALEIFLLNGRTYLVAFQSAKERDAFLVELSQCELVNRMQGDNLTDALEMWREGTLSNWEYLTQLNKMAGRSYNDLMQYPVFPFVLADYTSATLDLNDPKSFRNFKKPMAIQNKCNEQHYVDNYNYFKQEGLGLAGRHEPYHYGSHYSNSGIVLHFLVRLPPFTGMFLHYQDNNFDLPDRTFHSLHTTWRLTSSDSTTDVKEMIPEFFFLPEFLINYEGFDFGVRQSGERVDSVQLPSWCLNDPRLFILIHRQALESAYVRENLPHWIDLVFGYKQSGKAAVDAINVFHPATYCGFDVSSIKDPLERVARETMVRTYGQTPRQLFRSLHPMALQSLTVRAVSHTVPPVLASVQGLSWGSYVGSPAEAEPVLVAKHQHRTLVADLIPLHSNDVFGLAPHTSILLCYSKEKALSLINSTVVQNVALATWGHADSIVRVKLKKEQPPWPVVRAPELDPICTCASVPDCHQLWIGHLSGRLVVYRYNFEAVRGQIDFNTDPISLLGHTGAILKIHLSRSFSIGVSASQDNTAIIWDLNSLSYVRSIHLGSAVSLVSVSETQGDIVSVCHTSSVTQTPDNPKHSYNPWNVQSSSSSTDVREDTTSDTESPSPGVPDDWEVLNEADTSKEFERSRGSLSYPWQLKGLPKLAKRDGGLVSTLNNSLNKLSQLPQLQSVKGSSLFLHTVNATFVGSISTSEQITAVCFSTAPEGLSVNVIATGLFTGAIRLWSSWDLTPVREILSPALTYPIISLTYSLDSQHLYASSSDGIVAIWEAGGLKGTSKTPKFFNLTSL